jgi:Flp pilus assembly protein CpaB
MRSRGLVVAIAVVLAIVAAAAVILYTNGVKNNAVTAGAAADVVVASQNIAANTNLNPLIDQGAFNTIRVPSDAVVEGAVTDVNQLRDQTTTQPILANEQIPTSRLSSGTPIEGGTLGIDDGHVAVSLKVDTQSGVNGAITRGSYITVYASFSGVKIVPGKTPKAILAAATRPASSGTQGATGGTLPPITMTLIPAVKVLGVVNPTTDANGRTTGGSVTLTLDLTPEDAQELVYAQENGSTWIGLLPPGDTAGHTLPFAPDQLMLGKLLGKAGA